MPRKFGSLSRRWKRPTKRRPRVNSSSGNATRLDSHRQAAGEGIEAFLLQPPFSFFNFVEDRFGDYDSLRRVFSLARSSGSKALILEKIPAVGIIAEENEDLLALFPDYRNTGLLRLSFWKRDFPTKLSAIDLTSGDLVGYAIFKRDEVNALGFGHWHVFEAVFAKYPHDHNCVPRPQTYCLTVAGQPVDIRGLLYCQQNTLNKACAQVALRSLLSRLLPDVDEHPNRTTL